MVEGEGERRGRVEGEGERRDGEEVKEAVVGERRNGEEGEEGIERGNGER